MEIKTLAAERARWGGKLWLGSVVKYEQYEKKNGWLDVGFIGFVILPSHVGTFSKNHCKDPCETTSMIER